MTNRNEAARTRRAQLPLFWWWFEGRETSTGATAKVVATTHEMARVKLAKWFPSDFTVRATNEPAPEPPEGAAQ